MFNLELYELLRTGLDMLRQVYPTSERNCISSFTTKLMQMVLESGDGVRLTYKLELPSNRLA